MSPKLPKLSEWKDVLYTAESRGTDKMETIRLPHLTRLEVIDHRKETPEFGRRLVIWTDKIIKVELSEQDDGRTLKIFVSDL